MSEAKPDVSVRKAELKDTGLILDFIRELASYEKMENEVKASRSLLADRLFVRKEAEALIVCADGKEAGFALYFHNFSTFEGKAGLYLEDIYIRPEYRHLGCGRALMNELARIAVSEGCPRLEWSCLDWNKPSIDFYFGLKAHRMTGWSAYRLSGEDLTKLSEAKAGVKSVCPETMPRSSLNRS